MKAIFDGLQWFSVEGEIVLQAIKYLLTTVAVALLLSLGAFAKDNNSGSFDLEQNVQVGSTTLKPGHYKAEWTGSGDSLQVSILQSGKTVATAEGKLKALPQAASYNSVTLRTLDNQSKELEEIEFSNHKDALVLGGM